MKTHKKLLRGLLTGILITLSSAQDPFVFDSSLSSILPKSISNAIEIGDVNNDSHSDIILSGYDSTRFGVFIDVILGNNNGSLSQGY